ncbi:hypothetical protein [Euzebya sp.]|uniref:hypothetical protein n=1 Tax=Euzebya sp. TaxID=1971409 RepID=UPI003519A169
MSTIERETVETTETAPLAMKLRTHRLFSIVAIAAMVIGIGSVLGGFAGAVYTYDQAATQDITTPEDARIAEAPVRGPLTMWAQSDIITHHQLDRTGGLYYSQMEREVQAVDEEGNAVVDDDGQPVMVPNEARMSWLDATTLTTSLNMGIMAYALAAFAVVVGLVLTGTGWVIWRLRDAEVALH